MPRDGYFGSGISHAASACEKEQNQSEDHTAAGTALFFLYRCRKKKMLFAGLLCGILLLYFMSCFLWRIDIEGNQQITRGQICRYLETVHIENGTRISVIDCKELAAMLRKQFEAFTWVSVKQEGTRLLIQ